MLTGAGQVAGIIIETVLKRTGYASAVAFHDEFEERISKALRFLRDSGWISIDIPPRDDYDHDDIFDAEEFNKKTRGYPYAV